MNPLHVLVFSKDRACQLDGLLRSVADHLWGADLAMTVLFRASTEDCRRGYALVRERARRALDVRWVEENDFRTDVLAILTGLAHRAPVMLLVDDDLFFRPCEVGKLLARFSPRHLFISTRASRAYTRHRPPRFRLRGGLLEWRWSAFARPHVWHYPFSLDGNIFHAGRLARQASAISFRAPNSLEDHLHRGRKNLRLLIFSPRALAPEEAALVNNPMNCVQTEGETWNQHIDLRYLNDRFLAGEVLDTAWYYRQTPNDIHYAMRPVFIRA